MLTLWKFQKKNVYIFRLENKNFIYEESIQEKDKIIKKKNEEITKYKQKILEQKELLKEVYLMLENQNKKQFNLNYLMICFKIFIYLIEKIKYID